MKPLPATFFLISIIGFIISVYLTSAKLLNETWGFTFSLTFLIMFISGIVSITPDEKDLEIDLTTSVIKKEKKKKNSPKKSQKSKKKKN